MSLEMPTLFAAMTAVSDGESLPVVPVLPRNWQIALPDAASPVMAGLFDLHRLLFYVVVAAFAVLAGALLWVLLRYNRYAHPVARKTRHNPLLQAAWIFFPTIVLVLVAIPSLKLLSLETTIPKADLKIDVVGRVGSWSYEYPDLGDVRFDSHLMDRKTAKAYRQPYLLGVDYPLEVPVNRTVELRVTSADLVHSWSVPALGVRVDAVPGRINRVWFRASKVGIYYGLCSEMCGVRKDFMPVAVKVVSPEEFQGWLSWAEGKFADAAETHDRVAVAAEGNVR